MKQRETERGRDERGRETSERERDTSIYIYIDVRRWCEGEEDKEIEMKCMG